MNLPIIFVPLVRQTKRLFRGRGSLQSVASKIEVLCPEEKCDQHNAYYLPSDLLKVTGTRLGTSRANIEFEIERATTRGVIHDASLAFHFKNAVIINGRVYVENYKHAISNERQLPSPETHFSEAALVSTWSGSTYFGHWLSDDCLQYQLALNLSLKPICISRAPYSHQSYYERYFNQDWTPQYRSRIDNLIVFQDYSQGSSKRQRYEALRSKLSEQLTPNGSNNGLVYLRRGNAGSSRRVLNESELEKELSKRGFVIADSNDANPEAMLRSMMGAKLIVSMEGSHNLPFLFTMATNGGLIMLQPSDRFEAVIRGLAGCLGIKFGFLVGSKEGDGYRFSIPDLLKVIDRILA